MQSSNKVSNPSAQMTLSYVISLNLIKDSNTPYPRAKRIEPCSKMHLYRSAKISAERHQRTHCLDLDVIHARISSGLLVAADVSSQHSSRRTFGAPRSMSTRHLRQDNLGSEAKGIAPRVRCRSADSRFSRLKKNVTDDTQKPSRGFLNAIPWAPISLKSWNNQNNHDLFLNSRCTDMNPANTVKANLAPIIASHKSEPMKKLRIMKSPPHKQKEESVVGRARIDISTRVTLAEETKTASSSSSSSSPSSKNRIIKEEAPKSSEEIKNREKPINENDENQNLNLNLNYIVNKSKMSEERDNKISCHNITEKVTPDIMTHRYDKEGKIVLSEDYKIDSAENRINFQQKKNDDEVDKMPSRTCKVDKRIESGYQENYDCKEQHTQHSTSTSTSTSTYFVLDVSILSKKDLNSNSSKNNNNQQDNNESSSCSSNSISDVMLKNRSYLNSTSSSTIVEGETSHRPGIFITKRGVTKRAILRSLSTQLSLVLTDRSRKGKGVITSSHGPALPCNGSLTVYPHVTLSHSVKLHLASQNTLHGINKSPHIAHNTHNASSTHSKNKTYITNGNTLSNKDRYEKENKNKNESENENENENENDLQHLT